MDPFALDTATAEGLVTGIVDAGDAPPEYRTVALTLHALRAAPESWELAGEPAAVARVGAAVVVRGARPTRRTRRKRRSASRAVRLAAAAGVVGVMCVTGAFASAGALPQPAQHAASSVLGTVGISVPSGGEKPTEEPPATVEGTTPPGATTPKPAATAPGVGAAPPVPSNPASPANSANEDRGNTVKNWPPGKANGHDKTPSPNGQPDHSSPQGRGNGNKP
jgi:hypothetical protein